MLVLDSSALLHPMDFDDAATVPGVLDEVKNRPSQLRIDNALAAGKLSILEPSQEKIAAVSEICRRTGDALSGTDIGLVALALEHKAVLVTDDYGMQNVARLLGVEFKPVSRSGIKRAILWDRYCPNCKKPVDGPECPACGSATRRRMRKPG